jgi:hypothetical protein
MRFILQYLLPMAFPTAMYFLWMLYSKHRAEEGHEIDLSKGPWLGLFMAGVIIMGISLVIFNQMDGVEPGGIYQPPAYIDGKIIPGHVIPKP